MRIISGAAKGINLEAGSCEAVRPTTDRIKETLFNIIGDVENCIVVDFFAGSGALGLEALSRGADQVYFIEQDATAIKTIEKNLAKVEKSMKSSGRAKIIRGSVFTTHTRLKNFKPDIILADPPYADNCKLAIELLENQEIADWCHEETILCLEHLANAIMPTQSNWKLIRRKDLGLTTYTFWEKA
jgi:16S rRNA (guanine966-N2)-methyltransferase